MWWALKIFHTESRVRARAPKKQHVVRVDHGGVGRLAMLFPNRPTIKFFELTCARDHIGKPPQPDEAIRIIEIAKLSDHGHAGRFLSFDEVPFKERNQHFASAGHESVLPKFDYGTAGLIAHNIR